jgi:hypothetical protein
MSAGLKLLRKPCVSHDPYGNDHRFADDGLIIFFLFRLLSLLETESRIRARVWC